LAEKATRLIAAVNAAARVHTRATDEAT